MMTIKITKDRQFGLDTYSISINGEQTATFMSLEMAAGRAAELKAKIERDHGVRAKIINPAARCPLTLRKAA